MENEIRYLMDCLRPGMAVLCPIIQAPRHQSAPEAGMVRRRFFPITV